MHGPTRRLAAVLDSRVVKLGSGIAAFAFFSIGCAVTDYRGYLNHATSVGPLGVGNPDIWCARDGKDSDGDSDRKKSKGKGECGEAKLFGLQIAVTSADPEETGTYDFTVAYDFRGRTTPIPATGTYPSPIDITTYRNRVVGAFNGDGRVDRDGDDVRWNAGDLNASHDPSDPAGIWERRYLYRDRLPGCQFAANFEKAYADDRPNKGGDSDSDSDSDGKNGGDDEVPDPAIQTCFNSPQEEIDDRDLSLQCGYRGGNGDDDSDNGARSSRRSNDPNPATPACEPRPSDGKDSDDDNIPFTSLDDLFKQIWSGGLKDGFSLDLVRLTITSRGTGTKSVSEFKSQLPAVHTEVNGLRPPGFALDLTSAASQRLIEALLDKTEDGVGFTFVAEFDGGLTVASPAGFVFRVSHADLERQLSKK